MAPENASTFPVHWWSSMKKAARTPQPWLTEKACWWWELWLFGEEGLSLTWEDPLWQMLPKVEEEEARAETSGLDDVGTLVKEVIWQKWLGQGMLWEAFPHSYLVESAQLALS